MPPGLLPSPSSRQALHQQQVDLHLGIVGCSKGTRDRGSTTADNRATDHNLLMRCGPLPCRVKEKLGAGPQHIPQICLSIQLQGQLNPSVRASLSLGS